MALERAQAGEVVDLRPLGSQLETAKTTAIIKEKSFEAVRLVVRAGQKIPPHQVAGNITLGTVRESFLMGIWMSTSLCA